MELPNLVAWAFLLFPISEIVLATKKRARSESATVEDRGSMRMLWIVISIAVTLGFLSRTLCAAAIHAPAATLAWIALALLAAGLTLRWISIVTLGRFFTVNVAAHRDHQLVEIGPYRYVRHPSYTGLLIAFLGLAVFIGNWIGLALVMIPILAALLRRIRVEEAALTGALGETYVAYCKRTRRLIPGLL